MIKMELKVRKWGNSSGLTIPKVMLETLGLGIGDKLEVTLKDGKIVMEKPEQKKERLTFDELFEGYSGESFKTELQEFEPMGEEKW